MKKRRRRWISASLRGVKGPDSGGTNGTGGIGGRSDDPELERGSEVVVEAVAVEVVEAVSYGLFSSSPKKVLLIMGVRSSTIRCVVLSLSGKAKSYSSRGGGDGALPFSRVSSVFCPFVSSFSSAPSSVPSSAAPLSTPLLSAAPSASRLLRPVAMIIPCMYVHTV